MSHDIFETGTALGKVEVRASKNGGHSAEAWADMLMNRLFYISDDAPPEIRVQAQVVREKMREEVLNYMKQAIRSDRVTVCNKLRACGYSELAAYIWGEQ